MITKQKVEKVAVLRAFVEAATGRLDKLKAEVRATLQPTEKVKGFASFVHLSEEPLIAKVVDYRAELVKMLGAGRVAQMEAKAAKKLTFGTPRVLTGLVDADNAYNEVRAMNVRDAVMDELAADINNF